MQHVQSQPATSTAGSLHGMQDTDTPKSTTNDASSLVHPAQQYSAGACRHKGHTPTHRWVQQTSSHILPHNHTPGHLPRTQTPTLMRGYKPGMLADMSVAGTHANTRITAEQLPKQRRRLRVDVSQKRPLNDHHDSLTPNNPANHKAHAHLHST